MPSKISISKKAVKKAKAVLLFLTVCFLPFISLAASREDGGWLDVNFYDSNRTNRYGGQYGSGGGGGGGGGQLWDILFLILDILSVVVVLLIALAVVFFLYGILKYITSGGDEERRKEGSKLMLFGIIGLFVMISFWGIVKILVNTFDLDDGPPDVPYLYDTVIEGSESGNDNNDSQQSNSFYNSDTDSGTTINEDGTTGRGWGGPNDNEKGW